MYNEQYIESGLSVGTMKIANKYEIFTEEEVENINNKIPELDERVGVIEDEIEEINSSLDNMKINKLSWINVVEFGADNEGKYDCWEIIQLIVDEAPPNTTLFFPKGIYKFDNTLVLKQDINLQGECNNKYMEEEFGSILKFVDCNGIKGHGYNKIMDLTIVGTSNTSETEGITGYGMRIERCHISYFKNGINCKASLITNNTINRCYDGITGIVDSRVLNNTINANTHNGINLYQGCNDNIISNNKIEWNAKRGIIGYKCKHNVISSNVIDRNSNSGVELNDSVYNIISNNLFRRNSTNDTLVGSDSCNIRIEKCYNTSINGNVTVAGSKEDDGSGSIKPSYGCYVLYSDDLVIVGNDFTGGTEGTITKYNNGQNITEINLGYNVLDIINPPSKSVSIVDGTGIIDLDIKKPSSNGNATIKKFGVYARKSDNSICDYKEFIAYAYYKYNTTYTVVINDNTLLDSHVTITGSFIDDKLQLTFTNAKNISIKIQELN